MQWKTKHFFESNMSSAQQLQIQWDYFEKNIAASFRDLRSQPDFADVTLVCADTLQKIKAHKLILSGGSDIFRAELAEQNHPHPKI